LISTDNILNAKVLVVDDMEANVRLLEGMLHNAGYVSVESTSDPSTVYALHLKNRYDLILLDLQMPVMDGFQVTDALKEIEPDGYLPVLVITAQPGHKLRALQAGAKDFIGKPFELAEVLVRVRNMLEVRLLHGESKNYSKALEQKVEEVEISRDLIRRQSDEVKRLYDEIVAEQKRSMELSLQPGAMVGVEKEERLSTPWFRSLKLRHPWLQINLLTAFSAGAVVGIFQGTIDRLLILTVFLPVVAGQADNTGSQALAITLRGITLGDLESGKEKAMIRKEALLGLLNGALVGLVAAIGMYVVAAVQNSPSALMLSIVVFIAMTGSCVFAGICGAVVPLILKKLGADPVTASTIFLTTAIDVVSMGVLLWLATVLVK
jgi:CheY-like chemotaxis protein/cation transporter-like permease